MESKLQERSKAEISLERARLLTASWKTTDSLPIAVRRGKAFEKIVSEIPIYIDNEQLLVGILPLNQVRPSGIRSSAPPGF